jgi:sulfur-oxidizing protein SoxY
MMVLTRRDTLRLGLAGAGVALGGGTAWATPAETAAEIAKFTAGKATEPGTMTIDLPEIAENGNAVPLSILVDSPMTAEDHVTDILVVADGNPRPGIASFHFTPRSGRAMAATRIRLATTENVIVVARTSAGRYLIDQKQVKVTIGGCGG